MKRLLVLPIFFFLLIEAFDQDIPELVENTSPAVVNITSKREVTYSNQDYFRGMPEAVSYTHLTLPTIYSV